MGFIHIVSYINGTPFPLSKTAYMIMDSGPIKQYILNDKTIQSNSKICFFEFGIILKKENSLQHLYH